MDWSNPIPNITYSIIGAIILLIALRLFKTTATKIKKDRKLRADIISEIQKYLNPGVPHDLRQSYITFITAFISSAKTFETRFYFNWLLCVIISLWCLSAASSFGSMTSLVINIILLILVIGIGLFLTSTIGKDISQFEKTLWNELFKITESLENQKSSKNVT